ncbi:hypothetical protein [Faecalibacillus intestinalis]|jgi:hypothetical protein|uniref:hypothetical protein n=1 Tax=Faecalibacillus intestinalis TaxID=1982626 RepID=UPI0022E09D90|nr:hypothetical protein [Faecalibacillus intestinalis]
MDIKKLSKTNESGLRKNSDLKYLLYEEINDGKIGDITTRCMAYLLSFMRIELESVENQFISDFNAAKNNEFIDYELVSSLNKLKYLIDDFLKIEDRYYDEISDFVNKESAYFEYDEMKSLFNYIVEFIDKIKKLNF